MLCILHVKKENAHRNHKASSEVCVEGNSDGGRSILFYWMHVKTAEQNRNQRAESDHVSGAVHDHFNKCYHTSHPLCRICARPQHWQHHDLFCCARALHTTIYSAAPVHCTNTVAHQQHISRGIIFKYTGNPV